MTDDITPPWTDAQVETLNAFQTSGLFHPYTCPNRGAGHAVTNGDLGGLRATTDGWVCESCDYTQRWAHAATADPAFLAQARDRLWT